MPIGIAHFLHFRQLLKFYYSILISWAFLTFQMLSGYDDVGVLLTDKTKDEVLRKFEEYRECDFLKLGQTPMEPMMICLYLPVQVQWTWPHLGCMLSLVFRLLKKKMFTYVLAPLCCWSASTGKVEYIHLDPPRCRKLGILAKQADVSDEDHVKGEDW
ncbi:hypothetical protein C5167_017472 [Papaver somniferum]|uniref:Uncharacterized protein n=1 Tax=Papaver somniferum TaxID=3469 RepID=A0A4Y7INL8_PAPSO|nr:hypothetical protein C5167_017472 [Papaver somniferum]